jgi:hypothetical protein
MSPVHAQVITSDSPSILQTVQLINNFELYLGHIEMPHNLIVGQTILLNCHVRRGLGSLVGGDKSIL